MNLPNKLTMLRIFLALIIIIILVFPFNATGIEIPRILVNEQLVVDLKYIVVAILFVIASLTDFFDGYIARKYNLVTDFGKMIDSIADKVLVNSVLIILSATGFIHPIIPVVIVLRDSAVNSIKMAAGNKGHVVAASWLGKVKAATLMVGITLSLLYNLPFELWNLRVADFLLVIASVLAIISGVQYYNANKEYLLETQHSNSK